MSEIEDNSKTDENTFSNYEDDEKLLKKKKKKRQNLFKKHQNENLVSRQHTDHNNIERNTNSAVVSDAQQCNIIATDEANERYTDDNLNDVEVIEDSNFYRCCCFSSMFKYLKRKLFKKWPSSPHTKRAKLNNEEIGNDTTPTASQLPNHIRESEAVNENLNGIIVKKTIQVAPEPRSIDHKDHSIQFDENTITSNQVDQTSSVEQVQKCKRNRRKNKSSTNSTDSINGKISEMPEEIRSNPALKKYWVNRYRLFSKYDEGIKLDAESWYSVTPEKISSEIARRCQCDVIIDAFCGAGGNTIQFAFTCERVIAIDIDAEKIKLAKHNASIYGVADRIEFIVGDFFEIAPNLAADVVFLSPPWGGPSYNSVRELPLQHIMEPFGGKRLYSVAKQISDHIAYFLPRNINITEIAALEPGDYVKIDRNYLNNRLIAITAYFGDLVEDYGDEWNN